MALVRKSRIPVPSTTTGMNPLFEIAFPLFMLLMMLGANLFYQTGLFVFVSVASGITAAYCVLYTVLVFTTKNLNIIRLAACQSALWYFFPLSYYLLIDTSGMLQVTESDLAGAVILIAVSLSVGWFFSFFLDFKVSFPRDQTAFLRSSDLFLLVFPLLALQILLLATGAWSYETTHSVGVDVAEQRQGPLTLFVSGVASGLSPVVAYNYGLLPPERRTTREALVLLLVVLVECIFWFVASRRDLMMVMALSAVGFSWGRIKHRLTFNQLLQAGVLLLVIGLVFVQANKVFYAMRLASFAHGERSQSISGFLEAMQNVPKESVDEALAQNLQSRPYTIESVAIMYKYATGNLFGKELLFEFAVATPSIFLPGKDKFLDEFPEPEALWARFLGLPFTDYANSLVLDGYADFWYFGFLVSCSVSAAMFLITYKLISLGGNKCMMYFCSFSFLYALMQVETSYAAFISLARNLIALFVITGTLQFIGNSIRMKGSSRRFGRKLGWTDRDRRPAGGATPAGSTRDASFPGAV